MPTGTFPALLAVSALSAFLLDSATATEWVLRGYLAIAKVLRCTPQSHSRVLRIGRAYWGDRAVPVGFQRFPETPGK